MTKVYVDFNAPKKILDKVLGKCRICLCKDVEKVAVVKFERCNGVVTREYCKKCITAEIQHPTIPKKLLLSMTLHTMELIAK